MSCKAALKGEILIRIPFLLPLDMDKNGWNVKAKDIDGQVSYHKG